MPASAPFLQGKKKSSQGPLHHSSNVLVWVGLGNRVFPTLSNFKRTPHSSIKFDDFCDNRVTIVDQRATGPSGSEKQADQPTHVWHHIVIMSHPCLLETKQKGDLLGQYDARILIFHGKTKVHWKTMLKRKRSASGLGYL